MGKDSVLGLENLAVFFLANTPKQIYKFSAVPENIPEGFVKYNLSSWLNIYSNYEFHTLNIIRGNFFRYVNEKSLHCNAKLDDFKIILFFKYFTFHLWSKRGKINVGEHFHLISSGIGFY